MRRSYPTRSPPVVRALGCYQHRRGIFSAPRFLAERAWGRKSAGTKGAQGRESVERFLRSKTRRAAGSLQAGGRAFGASLARTTAGATLSAPLRASLSLDSENKEPDHRDVKSLYRQAIFEGG